MPSYIVHRYRKIKTTVGLRNVAAHNMRVTIYDKNGKEILNRQTHSLATGESGEWFDPKRGKYNIYDYRNPKRVLKAREERIKSANLPRRPQKNAARAIEVIFSASPEWCKHWETIRKDRIDWNRYLLDSRKWLEDIFGKENILHSAIHFDEKTPHMHVLFVPIKKTIDGREKYTSSSILGGQKGLSTLQTKHYEYVTRKGPMGLERGIEGSRATHIEREEYERKMREQKISEYLLHHGPSNFSPKLQEKPRITLGRTFLATDGRNLPWNDYVNHEIAIQYENYVNTLYQQNQAMKGELDFAESREQHIKEREGVLKNDLDRYMSMTPDELRGEAINREEFAKEMAIWEKKLSIRWEKEKEQGEGRMHSKSENREESRTNLRRGKSRDKDYGLGY